MEIITQCRGGNRDEVWTVYSPLVQLGQERYGLDSFPQTLEKRSKESQFDINPNLDFIRQSKRSQQGELYLYRTVQSKVLTSLSVLGPRQQIYLYL